MYPRERHMCPQTQGVVSIKESEARAATKTAVSIKESAILIARGREFYFERFCTLELSKARKNRVFIDRLSSSRATLCKCNCLPPLCRPERHCQLSAEPQPTTGASALAPLGARESQKMLKHVFDPLRLSPHARALLAANHAAQL